MSVTWLYSQERRQWEEFNANGARVGVRTDEEVALDPRKHPYYVEPRTMTTADIVGFEPTPENLKRHGITLPMFYETAASILRARRGGSV